MALFFLGACNTSGNTETANTETQAAQEPTQQTAITAGTPERLGPGDFLAKLQSTPGAQLIDVRTAGEVALGMIPECTNFDFGAPDFQAKIAGLDKEKPVFVYCAAGGRSGRAATLMSDLGFKEIYDLEGGFTAYNKEGLEVVKQ